ncbi:MAG: hypothetical protein CVV27_05565 [Candidatus Melainabacteria bacterium HGW-Melainabacteria-1]|nr:MAG: hypothetical protein CVV27_05565 [Candidatus Melainabacteria bacterium HGW-Melainabacteria-1]
MVRSPLPIYARTRAASGKPGSAAGFAALSGSGRVVRPAVSVLRPVPATPSLYQLSTHAGKVDTVWHLSSHGPRRPLPIPVWRSGFRDGFAGRALFNKPTGLAVDRRGRVYVADSLNHCIRRIAPSGRVTTLAGNGERGVADGSGRKARFNHPTGLALSPANELYVVDQGNGLIRRLNPDGQVISLAPCGRPLGGIAIDGQGLIYLLIELRLGDQAQVALSRLDPSTGENAVLADWEGRLQWLPYRSGEEMQPFSRWWLRRGGRPQLVEINETRLGEGLGLASDARGNLHWLAGYHLYRLEQAGDELQLQRQAIQIDLWPMARWQGLSVDAEGVVHVLDAHHHSLYRIQPGGEAECVFAAGSQGLLSPHSVATDAYGQIYISDTGHWRVCRLVPPGRETLLQLAKLAFLPYLPAPPEPDTVLKGLQRVVERYLRRKPPPVDAGPLPAPVVAETHVLNVLSQGKRSQQLAVVKELVDLLRRPGQHLGPLQTVFETLLAHPDASVRTLLIRHLCDLVHHERDALFWIALLDRHHEPNRLLKKYLIEVLVYLGGRYELYGHVVPLLVEYVRAPEEDVVEHVFQHLLAIRQSGYESLVDPLIEELGK